MLRVEYDGNTGSWFIIYGRPVLFTLGLICVGAGVAALTGPWWIPFVAALFSLAEIQVNLSFQVGIGIALTLLGLAFIGTKVLLDKKTRNAKRDYKLFSSVTFSLDTVYEYLDSLLDDHSYLSSQDTEFQRSIHDLKSLGSRFKTKGLRKYCKNYLEKAIKLQAFVAISFFVFPNHQDFSDVRYCMHPDLNIDRGLICGSKEADEKYRRYDKKLHELAQATYSALRKVATEVQRLGDSP